VNWIELDCPGYSAASTCSYQNPSASTDMAVTLFFQVEDPSGSASLECKTGDMVHCRRGWAASEQGSAGSCFFLLGAGESFDCSGSGTVNTIGSHGLALAGQVLGSETQELSCKGALTTCSDTNAADQDKWVELAFSLPSSNNHALTCSVDDNEVCRFAANDKDSASSCAFLFPSGSTLSCLASTGAPVIEAAVSRVLQQRLTPLASPVQGTCPTATGDEPTPCDCSFPNTMDTDVIVTMSASNQDDQFNSFHCYVGNANTCAWGANNGESGAAGQCSFILPAGASYDCNMQFGATAFPSVTILPLATTIFPAATEATNTRGAASGISHITSTRPDQDLARLFDEFQEKHGTMNSETMFKNFKRYVALVDNHPTNSPLTSGAELSRLAVLSVQEFEASYRGCSKTHDGLKPNSGLNAVDLQSIPSSIDWRDQGAVTLVKDQGQCGSCWSFSTTGVLEGAWAVAGHGLQQLSEQQLVSCDNADDNDGCNGGWPYLAMDYVRDHGIDTEASYPYTSAAGYAAACQASSGTQAAIQVTSHIVVESDEDAMAAWVTKNGPLSISVDAMTQYWWPYTSGIMSTCCNTDVDHAVLIVGFGIEAGQKYWLIKNSWSDSWGEKGYLRLERGSNQCGITYQPVGAIVSGSPSPSPTPPPSPSPTPPTPPPSPVPTPPSPSPKCPPDSDLVSTDDGRDECLWTTGAHGLTIPSTASEYCEYIGDGYFGYSFEGDCECADSAQKRGNFCLWTDGQEGVTIPSGSTADCSHLSEGRIGMVLPAELTETVV